MPIAYPISLQRLIGYFSKLPGVGKRSAERLALAALKWPENELAGFADALGTIREHIHPCRVCGNLAEEELCPICQDATRTKSIVCVVEQPTQIIVLENAASCRRCLESALTICDSASFVSASRQAAFPN